MSKIFDTFDVDYNSVSFRYTASGIKELVFVDKPDGIGVTQWMDFWEGVKVFYESGKSIDDLIEEAQAPEIDNLKCDIESLQDDLDEQNEENIRLQDKVENLEIELDDAKSELEELRYGFESLDK